MITIDAETLTTIGESDRLAELEEVIERGLRSSLEAGQALAEIRDKRLYRANFDTFKAYCKVKWGIGESRSYQLINAVLGIDKVLTNSTRVKPGNEAQMRVLNKFPEEQRPEIWARALEISAGEQPTTKQITQAHKELFAPPESTAPSLGIQYADMAISILESIHPEDTQRAEAMRMVGEWMGVHAGHA